MSPVLSLNMRCTSSTMLEKLGLCGFRIVQPEVFYLKLERYKEVKQAMMSDIMRSNEKDVYGL